MMFETLYRFAKKYKCNFTYFESEESKSCTLLKNDDTLTYSESDKYKYMIVNSKSYEDFQQGMLDFECLILLHEGK